MLSGVQGASSQHSVPGFAGVDNKNYRIRKVGGKITTVVEGTQDISGGL